MDKRDEFVGTVRHVFDGQPRVIIEMSEDAWSLFAGERVIVKRANESDPDAPIPFRITDIGRALVAA